MRNLIRYVKVSAENIRLTAMMYVRFSCSLQNVDGLLHGPDPDAVRGEPALLEPDLTLGEVSARINSDEREPCRGSGRWEFCCNSPPPLRKGTSRRPELRIGSCLSSNVRFHLTVRLGAMSGEQGFQRVGWEPETGATRRQVSEKARRIILYSRRARGC